MVTLKITLTGVEATITELDRRLALAKSSVADDLRWFGKSAKEEMIATHTFQNRTFRLEGSIDFDVVDFANRYGAAGAYVVVFALTVYASMVEFGVPGKSRPYPFFWPVFWKYAAALEERLQASWKMPLEDGVAPR